MSNSGAELGADLVDLKIISMVDLPALEYTYTVLNNAIVTSADDPGAFQVSSGTGMSQTYGPWTSVRDELLNVFSTTASNVRVAGMTLNHIITMYAESDAEAARALNGAWENGPPTNKLESAEKSAHSGQIPPILGEEG